MTPSHLQTELRKFDLSEHEALVYLACLECGPSSILDLARKTKLNRVSIYGLVETLMKKGFLREEQIKGKRKIGAYSPTKLYDIVTRRQEKLERQIRQLDRMVPELKALSKTEQAGTNIIYYEGEEGLQQWGAEALETRGELLEWTKIESYSQPFKNFLEKQYYPIKFKRQIPTRFIFLDTPEAHNYVNHRYMNNVASPMKARFIDPKLFETPGFMVIYNDRLSVALPKELRAVTVVDPLIADTQRRIFEFGWLHAKDEVQNKPYPTIQSLPL